MATDSQLARDNYERFGYARDNGHLDFIAKAEMCDNYFLGEQWDPATRDRLNRLNKPAITVNKVLSTCATVFGEQLNNRADVTFRPSKDATAEVASALDKVWLHMAHANDLTWVESAVAIDGFIRGRGFFDVRMNFDDSLQGEVRITQLNAKNVLIDPDAENYDPDEWKEVFVTRWMTGADVGALYGDAAERELKQRSVSAGDGRYDQQDWLPDVFGGDRYASTPDQWDLEEQRRLYRVIERQYREFKVVPHFVDVETGDMRPIPETWDRERIGLVMQQFGLAVHKRKIEGIRWVTSISDLILHNADSPYKHFTPVPYFPYFLHGRTMGIVENLISPQDLFNKAISQELHITNTTANSGWIVKNGSLSNMTVEELQDRGGEDGLVLVVNGNADDITKIQPNQVPTGIDRLSFKADEALKEVSMVSDSMRGFDRADVAAKAIQAKQSRGAVSLAKPFDNLGYSRKLVARNTLDLFQTFYTEQRVLTITGRNLTDQPVQITINEPSPEGTIANDLTVGEFAVVVSTIPARDTFEQSQLMEAMEMRQLGVAIPDDVLVEHSHLNRKTEIAERIKQLTGGAEPSQQQIEAQQLEAQIRQLEAQEMQVNMEIKQIEAQTKAQLDSARAQEIMAKMQNPEGASGIEQKIELARLAMDREKMITELEIQREKVQSELELARDKFQMEAQIKREAADLTADVQMEKVETDRSVTLAKMQQEAELAEKRQQLDEKIATKKQALAEKQAARQASTAKQSSKEK